MSEMYEVQVKLTVSGPERRAHFQHVVDAYAELEGVHAELLDASFGFSDQDGHADVDVEVTVLADGEDKAHHLAMTSVRSAIQAAGGFTAGWDDRAPKSSTIYHLRGESIDRVVPA